MAKKIAFVVGIVLLVGIIVGATAIYNDYIEENRPSNIVIIGGKGDKNETASGSEPPKTETKADVENITEGSDDTETEELESRDETLLDTDGSLEESVSGDDVSETLEIEFETEKETEAVVETVTEAESETETEYVSPYLAPDFTVYDIEGNPVKLSDFRGKPIVLNFWASDCYYCVQEMPDFQKAYEKYGDRVIFLMVCHVGFANRSPAHEQSFIDKKGYTFPIYFDTKYDAVYTYGVSGIPQTFFIDRRFDLYTYIPGMADYESLEYCINLILE